MELLFDPSPGSRPLSLVATCPLGLEEFVVAELQALGLSCGASERGGVPFRGDWSAVARANVWLRTAHRVAIELARFPAAHGDDLAAAARQLASGPFAELLRPERSIAVVATSSRSAVRDTRWAALRVKDGLVDGQRERWGERSSVLRVAPDLPLRVRLQDDRATLLLDSSGEPLDRRGYRRETVAAPARETLAAACVLASGWDGVGPVVDPMCGSGTMLVEAAWIQRRWPPSRLRPHGFAFEGWGLAPEGILDRVAEEANLGARPGGLLVGGDRDPEAIRVARRSLATAGLEGPDSVPDLRVGDAAAFEPPPGPGLVLINPPYGERLEGDREMWRGLGDLLKRRFADYRAAVLAGGVGLGKEIGLKPKRRIPVWNGPLEARILVFDLY